MSGSIKLPRLNRTKKMRPIQIGSLSESYKQNLRKTAKKNILFAKEEVEFNQKQINDAKETFVSGIKPKITPKKEDDFDKLLKDIRDKEENLREIANSISKNEKLDYPDAVEKAKSYIESAKEARLRHKNKTAWRKFKSWFTNKTGIRRKTKKGGRK